MNVIRYAGGKTRALKLITPFVEEYDEIISPFFGGGSMEVEWCKNKKVIGYDVFDMLVNFWNVLLNNRDEFILELRKLNTTKEEYFRIKEELICLDITQNMFNGLKTDTYKRKETTQMDAVKMAAYYYYNHNLSFGPGFLGWPSSVLLNEVKWNKMIDNLSNFERKNLEITKMSFDESIKINNGKFLYLDPPYYLDKDSDSEVFKGLYPRSGISVHHNDFDHKLLRDLLMAHNGPFVMSYNNCDIIREYYKDFELHYPKWSYSMGSTYRVKESKEILIVKK
jgi:DNA adenine methylase